MTREHKKQELVIGKWNGTGVFVPEAKQPETPITDTNKMVAWAKESYKETPGTYDFVRKIPGCLDIAEQKTFSFKFG